MSRSLKAHILLVLITLIWGSNFVVIKNALADISRLSFNALRMSLAAVALAAVFYRELGRFTATSLRSGLLVGAFLFVGNELQTVGLKYTTPSKSAFLTGVSVVLVPVLLALFWRRGLNRWTVAGVLLAFVGLYLLTVPASAGSGLNLRSMNQGDLFTLGAAVVFAFHIILIEHATRAQRWQQITLVQVTVTALLMILTVPVAEKIYVVWSARVIWGIGITGFLSLALAFAIRTGGTPAPTLRLAPQHFSSDPRLTYWKYAGDGRRREGIIESGRQYSEEVIMNQRASALWVRLKANRLAYSISILITLTVGILIGTVISSGVKGQDKKSSSSDAAMLSVPSPQALSNQFSQISKQLEPSVVNINTESTIKTPHRRRGVPNGDDDANPFDDFFDRFFGGQGGQGGQGGPGGGAIRERSLGSGVIVDAKGYIVTNRHVVEKADRIRVRLQDDPPGVLHEAKVIGIGPGDRPGRHQDRRRQALPHRQAGQFRQHAGGRLGAGHRQSVWIAGNRDRRHRLRQRPQYRAATPVPVVSFRLTPPSTRATPAARW